MLSKEPYFTTVFYTCTCDKVKMQVPIFIEKNTETGRGLGEGPNWTVQSKCGVKEKVCKIKCQVQLAE